MAGCRGRGVVRPGAACSARRLIALVFACLVVFSDVCSASPSILGSGERFGESFHPGAAAYAPLGLARATLRARGRSNGVAELGAKAGNYRARFHNGARRELGREAMYAGTFGDNAVGRTYWIRKKVGEKIAAGGRSHNNDALAHLRAAKERAGVPYLRGMGERATKGILKRPGDGINGLPWRNTFDRGEGAYSDHPHYFGEG